MADSTRSRPRLVGINHVALEVGDVIRTRRVLIGSRESETLVNVDEAVSFYEDLFSFDLRGRSDSAAFLDMGDQFLAMMETEGDRGPDDHRHFGLVVDDAAAVERRLDELDVDRPDASGIDFRDPWGNRVQVVEYAEIQLSKADHVLDGMGPSDLEKTDSALDELAEKGLGPD